MFDFLKKKTNTDPELEEIVTPELDAAYEKYKDEFIKYLEDKYQRKFLPIALYPEKEFLEFRAYPEGGDKKKDEIHLYMHDYATENHIIEDNYFFETIRDEYDAYMKDVIRNYFESFKIFYAKELYYPKNLKLGDTWEYIRTNNIEFKMKHYIVTDDVMDEVTFKKRFYDLLLKLYNENVSGVLYVLDIKKGFLDKINDENRQDYWSDSQNKYEAIRISKERECIMKPDLLDSQDDMFVVNPASLRYEISK